MRRISARALVYLICASMTVACFFSGQAVPYYEGTKLDRSVQSLVQPSFGSQPLRYLTRPGDTLGRILRSFGVCKLWARGEAVEETLKLNPNLKRSSGDELYPEQWVVLPFDDLPSN